MKKPVLNIIITLFVGIVFAFVAAGNVFAGNLYARMTQPKSPTYSDNFGITFTVLDIQGRSVDAKCFKKGPSDGVFSQFGSTQTLSAGGNTGSCQVTSAIMNTNGTYLFYVSATAGGDSVTSETEGLISVDYNTSGPGTPTNYVKEHTACQYKISFNSADDGGKTVKVEIYRSENTSFNLDSGTRVGTVNIGSNLPGSYMDTVPDCNKNYYYAIRAFDSAGNGSGVIGDTLTNTTITTTTPATTTTTGAIPVSGEGQVLGKETTQGVGPDEGDTLGEATDGAKPTTTPEVITGDGLPKEKSLTGNWALWFIILVGLAFGGYYVFKKRKESGK